MEPKSQQVTTKTKISNLKQILQHLSLLKLKLKKFQSFRYFRIFCEKAGLKYHEQSLSFDEKFLDDSILVTDLITKEKNQFYLTKNEKNLSIKEATQISQNISQNVKNLNGFKQWKNGLTLTRQQFEKNSECMKIKNPVKKICLSTG